MFFKLNPFTLNIIMENIYYNLSSFYWEKYPIDKISFIKTEFIKMKKIWFFLLILFNIEKKVNQQKRNDEWLIWFERLN